MGPDAASDEHARLWRRQVHLTLAAAVVVLGAIGLLVVTLGLAASSHGQIRIGGDGPVVVGDDLSLLSPAMWPALLGLLAVVTVLTLTVAHTIRVAAFAFRPKGDDR